MINISEVQSLIEINRGDNNNSTSSSSESSCNFHSGKSEDFEYKPWKLDYGSFRNDEIVSIKNQLVFKWCDINAYGEQTINTKSRNFFDISFSKRNKQSKHILKNVSGVAYPGELLVLMGSSGAGKTTLLNCMTFRNIRNLKITGMVCLNDEPVTQKQLAAHSAYVQQDDLFIAWLTVREHLIFQALVRMNPDLSYREKLQRVEDVIGELSLGKCQFTQIGQPGVIKGISGGERKRLALASELLTNPSLLFCDEPTSGLDSFMSLNVVQMLKAMSRTGRTVICTLHQPSSELFQMFDKICLIAEGRTAFIGYPMEADEFFKSLQAPRPVNFNPADFYIQILSIVPEREESCRQAIKGICDAFDKSEIGYKIKHETSITNVPENIWSRKEVNPYKVSWISQFKAVSWRCSLSILKNPRLTKVRFFQVLVVSFLISLIFWQQKYDEIGVQNMNGALFLFLTNATFQNLLGVIMTFCGELPLFLRENKNGMYRTDVYFLAKIFADIPVFTGLNVMMTTICYVCIGLNPTWPKIFNTIGIMLLVVYAVMGAGYFISCIAPNIATANSMVTLVVTPFLIFGGFFLSVKSIPIYLNWLSDISWFKFGNTALMINQWENVKNVTCINETCPRNGEIILESLGMSVNDFWVSILGLVVLAIILRIISFLVLLYKAYNFE